MTEQQPITNCHTHIFTADQVPPLLGKSLIPFPLYYIVHINWIIAITRSARDGFLHNAYYFIKTPVDKFAFWYQRITAHYLLTKLLAQVFKLAVSAICTLFILSFLRRFFEDPKGLARRAIDTIFSVDLFKCINNIHWILKILILLFSLIFYRLVRNIAKMILFAAFSFLKGLMGSGSLQLLKRYYNIAVLSEYRYQEHIFKVLSNSYPAGSSFVVLPMDLDYIEAGKAKQDYPTQLKELIKLKESKTHGPFLLPFVFADPRRIAEHPEYYDQMIDCLENKGFKGIKIYPALGYYPFDKDLLKLFLYACEHEIPVLTHCIRGVIFYRGSKKKEWNEHPVFTEEYKGVPRKMQLREFDNINFINNFTHPLNYLCLLDPKFLKIVLHQLEPGTDLTEELYTLYGFTRGTTPESSGLAKDLRNLKLCFGHFGGEDEWARYIEMDRDSMNNKFQHEPLYAKPFSNPIHPAWQGDTWYSIIRSIIMTKEYPNVYADISFIIYDVNIISLLKSSLAVPGLREKILYGTDFYVVRQKGNDKKFWLDIQAHLTPEEMKLIAVDNPKTFIK